MLAPLDRLQLLLRPPGRGLPVISMGGGYAAPLLRSLYGSHEISEVEAAWKENLKDITTAEIILLGIPSDTGAGMIRGSNFGPLGIRSAYLSRFGSYRTCLLDIGDVICVPQLLHDDMLNDSQIAAVRLSLYGNQNQLLPVSPLSIAEQSMCDILTLNRDAKVIMLGGDHSVSLPVIRYLHHNYTDELAVLHFDAHTDLSDSRLGVKHCYNTWAYHTTRFLKPYHLVQIGIRASTMTKSDWTTKYDIVQIWANEANESTERTIAQIIAHLRKVGVRTVYISNDIDGTDPDYAPATGTPEPNGLTPQLVTSIIEHVGSEFNIIGGDIVEVAPPLSGSMGFENDTTCLLAASYLRTLVASMRQSRLTA